VICGTPAVSSVKHMPVTYKCHTSCQLSCKCINNSPGINLTLACQMATRGSSVVATGQPGKLQLCPEPHQIGTRKSSCRWQTRATLAKSLHDLHKSSGVVSCIARLPIDSVPMVSYYVLYSNCVCKMHRFGDTRLLKLPSPWNPGQGSLKVIESDATR